MEGWLKLASTNFQDLARYPPIPQPGNSEEKIKVEIVGPDGNLTDLQRSGTFRQNSRWSATSKDVPEQDAFYFRLSGLNLYFTESKGDMVVLGAIAISNIDEVDPNVRYFDLDPRRILLQGNEQGVRRMGPLRIKT